MKAKKLTVDEALRVVGHLLEHHPATRAAARNRYGDSVSTLSHEATCWCLTGALVFVTESLPVARSLESIWNRMAAVIDVSSSADMAQRWDRDPAWRAETVEKLKRAGLPAAERL